MVKTVLARPSRGITRVLASTLAAACLFSAALSPQPAAAKEKNGLAVGAEAGLTNTGLSVKYAIDNFHIQFLAGMDIFEPDDIDRVDYLVGLTLRFTYNVARMREETNLWVGAGGTFDIFNDPNDNNSAGLAVTVELLLGVEHFFNDFFAVSGYLGIPFELNARRDTLAEDNETEVKNASGFAVRIRSVAWGAGFHFYF